MRTKDVTPRAWPWLQRVAVDWLIICACMLLLARHPSAWTFALCLPVIGARQHAIALLGHDGAHRLICKNRALNDLLTGILCFGPLGFATNGYRRFHFGHHLTVGTAADPELEYKQHPWLGQWQVPLKPWRFAGQLASDLVGGAIPHLFMSAYLTRPVSLLDAWAPVLVFATAIAACAWFGCLWILGVWFGAIATTFWIAFRLRIWTEHTGTLSTHRLRANALQRFFLFPHNTWCHWEHHRHASVPCWALPAFREQGAATRTPGELFHALVASETRAGSHKP